MQDEAMPDAGGHFRRTYSMASDAPPPMQWDTYEKTILEGWRRLLGSHPTEGEVQQFLEQHPSLIPGAFGVIGTSGHAPHPAAVISQPPLPAFTRRVPDFMWIAKDSASVTPVLIEIEAPRKTWFTKAGVPTSQLTQALNQLSEWKAWFGDHHNQASFIKYYGVEMNGRALRPQYVLVYGRRVEFDGRPELAGRRAAMQAPDQVLMTFDRLAPDPNARNLLSATLRSNGYRALYAPPTTTLGPSLAEPRALLADKEAAINRSPHFSPERRAFLLKRMEYWDGWATRGARGITNLGDRE